MKRILSFLTIVLSLSIAYSQEAYDDCDQALTLCANTTVNVNNLSASVCTNCEDDYASCFTLSNTIWMSFESDQDGGDVSIDLSNLQFQTGSAFQAVIVEASIACDPLTFNAVSTCETNIVANQILTATGLPANTKYYLLINGAQGAEGSLDLTMSGTAVSPSSPQVVITYDNPVICFGEEVNVPVTVAGCNNNEVNWFINGNLIESNSNGSFSTDELQNGDVLSASVICFSPCDQEFFSNSINFTVNGYVVDAGPDLEIDEGETTALFASTNAPSFTWFPTIGMSAPNSIQPFVSPTETTTYTLTVSDGVCTSSDECTVVVQRDLNFANTFTPNGDGSNDTWEIEGISKYPDCQLEIFNRWGQSVYKASGYSKEKEWTGIHNGQNLPAGVYFYVLYLTKDKKDKTPIKGHVNLIR